MSQAASGGSHLSRRGFLKLAAAGIAGLAVGTLEPALGSSDVQAKKSKRAMCKAGPDGKILLSEDGGKSWQVAANFGPQYRVRRVAPQRNQYRADLIYQGKKIVLNSQDGRLWRTSDYQAPA